MNELNMAGEQRNTGIRIAATRAIFQIALDRTPNGGELATYLMMTAGEKVYLDKGVIIRRTDDAITQYGFLGGILFMVESITLVMRLIAINPMHEFALIVGRAILNYCPIGLVNFAIAEHIVESCESLGGACKDNKPTDRTVKTMNHTNENIAGLGVCFLYILLHLL